MFRALIALAAVAAPLAGTAQVRSPVETRSEAGIAADCGYYAVVGAARSLRNAVELQDGLGATDSVVLDHDVVPEFRNGYFSVAFGPYGAPAPAEDKVDAWRTRAPDAFVKFGCVEGQDVALAAPVPTPDPPAAAAPVADPAPDLPDSVPLPAGVYVLQGVRCDSPPPTAFRVYDGTGLSGPTTRACRFTIEAQDGDTYAGSNSCESVLYGLRTDTALSVRLLGPEAFRLVEFGAVEGNFRLCGNLDPDAYAAD